MSFAARIVDGFDLYGNTNNSFVNGPWDSVGGVLDCRPVTAPDARTGISIECRNIGTSETVISRSIPGAVNYFNIFGGFAFATTNAGAAPALSGDQQGFIIHDGFSTFVKFFTGNGGNNIRTRVNNTSFGPQSPANTLTTNAWVYVCYHFITDGITASLQWWVNGTEITSGPVSVPIGSGLNQIRAIRCASSGNTDPNYRYDDIFVIPNPTTDEINEVLNQGGEPAVYYQSPNADGVTQDWTPSVGMDGYAVIDEIPRDAADYIEAAAANDISQFDVATNPENLTAVHAVQHVYTGNKTTAGAGSVQGTLSVSGVGVKGADNAFAETGINYYEDAYGVNPNGGAAWGVADLNNLGVEFERTA